MVQQVTRIDFHHLETAIPSFLIVLLVPLTYSIAHGIGYGFIAFVAISVLAGRAHKVHPVMYLTALAFLGFLVFE
jgi:AGZA family xanthine/uracil permease-like MFS transporter